MKKYIFKIVSFFAVFAFFGCSSGEYVTDSEVSFDELKNMEGRNSGSITVITPDTTIKSISNWSVKDSSLVFLDYSKNHTENISPYQVKSLGDLNEQKNLKKRRFPNYHQPDTITVPFNSIDKIQYSGASIEGSGNNDESLSPRGGVEINSREKELTLALLTEAQIDFYRMVIKVNTTFLFDEDKTHISTSGLYSLGYMLVGGMALGTIHTEDVGKGGKMIYTIILGLPLMLTNAEHHLFLLNTPGPENTEPVSLSTFISFRTDYFDKKRVVYTPGVGVQIEYNWGNDAGILFGNSLGLKVGTEFPDAGGENPSQARLFLAVKGTF
jgi:hypothetical protein